MGYQFLIFMDLLFPGYFQEEFLQDKENNEECQQLEQAGIFSWVEDQKMSPDFRPVSCRCQISG
jgi:hypothetical protein